MSKRFCSLNVGTFNVLFVLFVNDVPGAFVLSGITLSKCTHSFARPIVLYLCCLVNFFTNLLGFHWSFDKLTCTIYLQFTYFVIQYIK